MSVAEPSSPRRASTATPPGGWRTPPEPRIAPAPLLRLSPEAAAFVGAMGIANRGRTPNIFATIARHRRLFRGWMGLAARVAAFGSLGRRDTELVVLRTAWNSGSYYAWIHHRRLGGLAGLDDATLDRITEGLETEGWTPWERTLLSAADELHGDQMISDATWAALADRYDERRLIELCFLVGHYQMVCMAVNSLGVQYEHGEVPR